MTSHRIDTSPKILQSNVKWNKGSLIEAIGVCATVIYDVGFSTSARRIAGANVFSQYNVFKDGQYVDYWSVGTGREQVNANCNGVSASLNMTAIENAYLYFVDTGEIIFAGKNTIYYGLKNINELN